jgi:hypothetical protein
VLNRRVSSFKTLLLWNKISQSNPHSSQQAARSYVDVAKPCQNEQANSVTPQPIGLVKQASASGMAVAVKAPRPSKADNVARKQRLFMATRPEPNGPSEAASQPNFTNWSTLAIRSGCLTARWRSEAGHPRGVEQCR